MIKMYQDRWFGIPFSELPEVSTKSIADSNFYECFYNKFFNKYSGWGDLSADWLTEKDEVASQLANRIQETGAKSVLSLGCGLGRTEITLQRLCPGVDVHVEDFSQSGLRWIKRELSGEKIHVGSFPECLPEGIQFDLIFAQGFDYAFDQESLGSFLKTVVSRLKPAGEMIFISSSHLEGTSLLKQAALRLKSSVISAVGRLGLVGSWQNWGWYRHQDDFLEVFNSSGLSLVKIERMGSEHSKNLLGFSCVVGR